MASLFGTDGIRTRVGNYPLDSITLPRIGDAFARFALQKYGPKTKILLGTDTRISCAFIKSALKMGLLRHDIELYDAQVLPTPAVHALVHGGNQFALGIIISASHNPYQDNGIKIVDSITGKLSPEDEQLLSQLMQEEQQEPSYDALGTEHIYLTAADEYAQKILTHFNPRCLVGKKVVLDCAHGATAAIAPTIFEQLGADVITINNRPNGKNINDHCGAVYPQPLQKAVLEHTADIGCAFDGDGDRITVVSKDGAIKDGDAILSLLLDHPNYASQNALVGTVMTNQGLEQLLVNRGKHLVRTPVGDKYIAHALHEQNLLLGGEPSGHIIMRDYLSSSDGIFAALRVIQVMLHTGNNALQTFTPFPNILINLPVAQKKELSASPCAELIAATKAQLPHGRLIVRYSGTENLLRIFVEDQDKHKAHILGEALAHQLQKELSS